MNEQPEMKRPVMAAGANPLQPLIDKVGVPAIWFSIGFIAAVVMLKIKIKKAGG